MIVVRYISLLVFCLILVSGCTIENLPISVEPAEPQIAVSSLIGPEETFFVALSRSFSALSAEDANDLSDDFLERILLDRAQVLLSYDGITDTLETVFDINGLYGAQLDTLVDFQLLELSVFDSTSSQSVSAQSVLLPQIEVGSITVNRDESRFDNAATLTYQIIDRPEENYYVIQAYQFSDGDSTTIDTTGSSPFFNNGSFLVYEQILTDRSADENNIIEREEVIEFSSTTDSALVVITNISEGYYRFLEARQRSGGLLSSLANEPVNHPSNVENGVGYFSAHRPRATLVIVGEE